MRPSFFPRDTEISLKPAKAGCALGRATSHNESRRNPPKLLDADDRSGEKSLRFGTAGVVLAALFPGFASNVAEARTTANQFGLPILEAERDTEGEDYALQGADAEPQLSRLRTAGTGSLPDADLPAANSAPGTPLAGRTGEPVAAAAQSRLRTIRLTVSHGGIKRFTLHYNSETVAIEAPTMRLSLTKRPCNAHIIDRFGWTMGKLVRQLTGRYSTAINTWEYTMSGLSVLVGDVLYVSHKGQRIGRQFCLIPDEVLRMKWEEKFNCSPQDDFR